MSPCVDTSNLAIRRPRIDEATTVSALMRANFLSAYSHCADAASIAMYVAKTYSTEKQAAELADPDIETLLVDLDGVPVGHAQLYFASPAPVAVGDATAIELSRFYIVTQYHGRGLADSLMIAAKESARRRGATGLWLFVWQQAPRAIAFYKRHGFHAFGTAPFVVGNVVNTDWVMHASV